MSGAESAREWLDTVARETKSSFGPNPSWGLSSALRGGTNHVRRLLGDLATAEVERDRAQASVRRVREYAEKLQASVTWDGSEATVDRAFGDAILAALDGGETS